MGLEIHIQTAILDWLICTDQNKIKSAAGWATWTRISEKIVFFLLSTFRIVFFYTKTNQQFWVNVRVVVGEFFF